MERDYLEGGIYAPTRAAAGSVRFAKVLAVARASVFLRPYARPPRFRWFMETGVPTLLLDPEPGDELAGPGVRVIEVSRKEFHDWGTYFYANVGFNPDEWQALNDLVLSQIPIIRPDLLTQLLAVEPSRDGDIEYRPCRVELKDGKSLDRVLLAEAERYIGPWGLWPHLDRGKQSISLEEVVSLEESPYRLPAPLATKMYEAGESAMGGCFFVLVLADGHRLPCETGNVVDFVELPPAVAPHDLVELHPHDRGEGGNVWRPEPRSLWKGADFDWCLYRLTESRPREH